MHGRPGSWQIEHHDAVPGREGLHRNDVRFCLQRLLHRFTIFGRSYYRNFGSWIVSSRVCRVKHNLTWTAFISWNSGLLDSLCVRYGVTHERIARTIRDVAQRVPLAPSSLDLCDVRGREPKRGEPKD